ncbi:septum site-determining protein MinC [Kushneria aurantia]|uniref:Probable septum site-determining protein MinC n=1 Tax=Kushneria aurantia TaxID=504092 RepID=A0ABV6G5E3_9GAMM|nr:septum site-determining protein MinC [Kushneria aurantia]
MSLKVEQATTAFTFKGGMLPMTVMELSTSDPERIGAQLAGKLSQAPAFFQHTPVVLSVEKLDDTALALERLCAVCRSHRLLPVAVRGGGEGIKQSAWALGLGWFPPQEIRETRPLTTVDETSAGIDETGSGRIHRGTVRSGQQVSAPGGDLVIIGAVNAGAEVLAAGSVHVYGPLRGRALAGIHGDRQAGIFCRELHAELLSVAGTYKRLEDVDRALLGTPVQIGLKEDQLAIEALV